MASRRTMARPKRAGEAFARTHHNDGEETKRVKFDVRNPSILAPDAADDDAVLDADVIGSRNNTKRGAVNIDGYDSDSDNENLNARAEARKKGAVNILDQLDNYNAKDDGRDGGGDNDNDNDNDDDDMFAADGDGKRGNEKEDEEGGGQFTKSGRKKKNVSFLDSTQIDGQEASSRSGGRVHLDERESSDDEEDLELAIQEEGIDEEVGAGGLKRNAPKVEAFHLKEEMEEGGFDQDGNYVRKANDPNAVHDSWLEGVSKKEVKRARAAHERREAEARRQRIEEDGVRLAELLARLIPRLERTETPLEALARLGSQTKKKKKNARVPSWKLKRMADKGMEVDGKEKEKEKEKEEEEEEEEEDLKQVQIKEAIDAITDAADKLLSRGHEEVYDQERELLVREYRRETGEEWVERPRLRPEEGEGEGTGDSSKVDLDVSTGGKMWEFRWTHGQGEAATQGPFDGPTMKAWQDAGYFGQGGVEFRPVGGEEWVSRLEPW